MAAGMISPTNKTQVTEMAIATYSFTSFPRKMGSASLAMAFQSIKVTSIRWCCNLIGKIAFEYFFSVGVPLSLLMCSSVMSKESKP